MVISDYQSNTTSHITDRLSIIRMENTSETVEKTEEPSPVLNPSPVINPSKRVHAKIVEDECKIEIPEGWRRQVVQRQGGMSAGKFDVYYFSPLGKKLRSKKEVQTYCEQNNMDVNLDLFRFGRISLSSGKSDKRKSLSALPKTPKTSKTPKSPKLIRSPKNSKSLPPIKPKATHVKKLKKSEKPSNTFLISSEGLINMKRKNSCSWVPPKSPFNLFQESLFQNPWKLLIGTIFLNKSTGDDYPGQTLLWEFFKRWATPAATMVANWKDIAEVISEIPNSDKLAKMIIQFSEEYLTIPWNYPKELHGISKYGNDSYRIFCVNEWRKVKPTDQLLIFYVSWLWDNHTLLGLD